MKTAKSVICGGRERCGADRQFCKNGKVIGWGDAGSREKVIERNLMKLLLSQECGCLYDNYNIDGKTIGEGLNANNVKF